jgi:hypothetical protein
MDEGNTQLHDDLVEIRSKDQEFYDYVEDTLASSITSRLDTINESVLAVDGSVGGLISLVGFTNNKLDDLIGLVTGTNTVLGNILTALEGFVASNHADFVALANVAVLVGDVAHDDALDLKSSAHTDALDIIAKLNLLATHTDVSATNTALGGIDSKLGDIQSDVDALRVKLATFAINGSSQLRVTLL